MYCCSVMVLRYHHRLQKTTLFYFFLLSANLNCAVCNVPPTLSDSPSDLITQCSAIPPVPEVGASAFCGNATVTFSNSQSGVPEDCTYQLFRTWVAVDSCDNTASTTQVSYENDTLKFIYNEIKGYWIHVKQSRIESYLQI